MASANTRWSMPKKAIIEVYRRDGDQFARQGVYGVGDQFAAPLFPDVTLDAAALLNG